MTTPEPPALPEKKIKGAKKNTAAWTPAQQEKYHADADERLVGKIAVNYAQWALKPDDHKKITALVGALERPLASLGHKKFRQAQQRALTLLPEVAASLISTGNLMNTMHLSRIIDMLSYAMNWRLLAKSDDTKHILAYLLAAALPNKSQARGYESKATDMTTRWTGVDITQGKYSLRENAITALFGPEFQTLCGDDLSAVLQMRPPVLASTENHLNDTHCVDLPENVSF